MTRRLPIRARLAVTSAALVVIVLLIAGTTVVILERRSLDDALAQQATIEARSLLAVASHDDPATTPPVDPTTTGDDDDAVVPGITAVEDDETETDPQKQSDTGEPESRRATTVTLDASTEPYLVRRSGTDTLLAVAAPGTPALINVEDARALVAYLAAPTGTSTIEVDDDGYTLAVARDATGITAAAAVPRAATDHRITEVIQALLIAGAVGILLTIVGAWFAARSALRPLTTMTRRAETVTAGRLDARVGPIGGDDEIARLTHAIDDMLGRLEAAFVAQQRFVQDASHELRTPITIARGHLEVTDPLREEPAAVQAAIGLAVGELARMGELVERLLVLARAGELPAGRFQRIAANALGDDALARVQGNTERRWEVRHAPDDPLVLGDHDALVDVLVNLLRNAERHTTAQGTIRIEIDATESHVELAVRDDGEGIDPRLLPTIFDRFTRADAARTRDAGGAGLGLAISQAYVEAHGGTLAVASAPGEGATFTIRLPRVA